MGLFSVWRNVERVGPGKYFVSVVTIARDGKIFPPCETDTAWADNASAAHAALDDMVKLVIDRVIARGGTVVQIS